MKKWMVYGLISAFAAVAAMSEDAVPWWKKPFVKNADEQTQVIPPAPAAPVVSTPVSEKPRMQRHEGLSGEQLQKLTPEQLEKMKARKAQMQQREGAGDGPRLQMNPQQMEKMKAQREEIMKLGEAARNEPDPAKKEMLISQLRAKLTEGADQRLATQKKRIEQAEREMPKLREKLADAESNKTARIEEQIQRILAGEPLPGPEGKRPELPGGGKHKKAAKASE